jgi:septal ring factor EnvC (AmiA/AmiB activator)
MSASKTKSGKGPKRYGLRRLGAVVAGFFKTVFSRPRKDRQRGGESPSGTRSRGKLFAGRHLLMAGVYLVTVILLLSYVVLKWGKVPAPELPGLESRMDGAFIEGEAVEEELSSVEGGEKENSSSAESAAEQAAGLDAGTVDPEAETFMTEEQEVREIPAVQPPLPQAASPLAEWELYSPFGSYVAEKLPSGGSLHRMTRGVYLQAPPGATVAALWDGAVVKVGNESSPYGKSVLLRHDGGHISFYGNLHEVWVEEGRLVSRGENIGVLLPSRTEETEEAGEIAAAAWEEGPVPIKTILKGYAEEVVASTETGAAPAEETFGVGEREHLLYLEVRLENNYLDPLRFIPARN